MNAKVKLLIGLAIFAIVLTGAYFGYKVLAAENRPAGTSQSASSSTGETRKEIPAPDFTVYDSQGNKVKLSDFAGRPVVLNFWASWCPPCKSEMPHFNKVYAEVKDDVVFMMVDLVDGQRETQAKGQAYIDEQGFTFPVYFDNDQDAGYNYGISSIPTTFFIDRNGNVQAGYQGAIDEETLVAALAKIRD